MPRSGVRFIRSEYRRRIRMGRFVRSLERRRGRMCREVVVSTFVKTVHLDHDREKEWRGKSGKAKFENKVVIHYPGVSEASRP